MLSDKKQKTLKRHCMYRNTIFLTEKRESQVAFHYRMYHHDREVLVWLKVTRLEISLLSCSILEGRLGHRCWAGMLEDKSLVVGVGVVVVAVVEEVVEVELGNKLVRRMVGKLASVGVEVRLRVFHSSLGHR